MSMPKTKDKPEQTPLAPQFFDASTPQEIGAALKALREGAGLSQKDIADKMGIAQQSVSRIENGGAGITSSTISRYAEAVGKKLVLGFH